MFRYFLSVVNSISLAKSGSNSLVKHRLKFVFKSTILFIRCELNIPGVIAFYAFLRQLKKIQPSYNRPQMMNVIHALCKQPLEVKKSQNLPIYCLPHLHPGNQTTYPSLRLLLVNLSQFVTTRFPWG